MANSLIYLRKKKSPKEVHLNLKAQPIHWRDSNLNTIAQYEQTTFKQLFVFTKTEKSAVGYFITSFNSHSVTIHFNYTLLKLTFSRDSFGHIDSFIIINKKLLIALWWVYFSDRSQTAHYKFINVGFRHITMRRVDDIILKWCVFVAPPLFNSKNVSGFLLDFTIPLK